MAVVEKGGVGVGGGGGCDGVYVGSAAPWSTEVRVLETKEQVMCYRNSAVAHLLALQLLLNTFQALLKIAQQKKAIASAADDVRGAKGGLMPWFKDNFGWLGRRL